MQGALRSCLRATNIGSRSFSTTASRGLARMQVIGRLADTPEATPTSTGREVIRYAVGVSSGPRDNDGNRATSWYRVSSFVEGPQKDYILGLQKGTLIYVDAEARMDSYQAADGSNQTRLNLVQKSIESLSRPRDQSTPDDSVSPRSGLGAS